MAKKPQFNIPYMGGLPRECVSLVDEMIADAVAARDRSDRVPGQPLDTARDQIEQAYHESVTKSLRAILDGQAEDRELLRSIVARLNVIAAG